MDPRYALLADQLLLIERELRVLGWWADSAPSAEALASVEPFCVDTLAFEQWLQWVFFPRMLTLLDNAQPLPQAFAVAPYYEMALAADHPQRDILLAALQELDALFTSDNA